MPRSQAPARTNVASEEEQRLLALVDELTFKDRRAPEPRAPSASVAKVERVVVGVGTDRATEWAIEWARALGPMFGPSVTLVRVEQPLSQSYTMYGAPGVAPATDALVAQEKAGLRILDEAAATFREEGDDVTIRQPSGSPVREIVKLARDEHADLVVVGSPSRSPVDRFLVGDVADGVKNHVETNVLLAKGPATPGDVLCPVDGSAASKSAAALALRIARAWGSRLRVVHVLEPAPGAPPGGDEARIEPIRAALKLPWTDIRDVEFTLLMGDPEVVIGREAERTGARLIVMGNRGLGGLRSLVAGSVTNHVTHHVEQSLLLVKEARGGEDL